MPEAARKVGGIVVRNTRNLINENTRICMALWAPFKFGKTTFAASLDRMTKKFLNKPSLLIGVEAAEGGGAMCLNDVDVDLVVPENLAELQKIIASLKTDNYYAGAILDNATDMVKRFLQPYALSFPSREHVATRSAGVPERSDYQTMGEACRIVFNQFIGLSTLEDLNCRKHVLVTALDLSKEDNGRIISVGPNLPGAMAATCGSMFQTVGEIKIKPEVVEGKRVNKRVLSTQGDGVRLVGDRTHVFPPDCNPDLEEIWRDHWIPAIEARKKVA